MFYAALVLGLLPLTTLAQEAAGTDVAPNVAITSPVDGTATNQTVIFVGVSFGVTTGNVTAVQLLVNDALVDTFNNPPQVREGTHVFVGVNLSAFANTGVPVKLVARAFQGNPRANLSRDSAPVFVIVDTLPPVISDLLPSNGSFTNDATPTLSAVVTDSGGAGVSSVVMKLDGAVVPASITFENANRALVTFTPSTPIAEGSHAFEVIATDRATNGAQASSLFTVDITPPVLSIAVSPSDPLQATKTILVTFHDELSGVVSTTRVILIDVVNRTTDGQFLNGAWTLTDTFAVGAHSVVAEARDRAGNVGQATVDFEVRMAQEAQDIRKPAISFVYPTFDFAQVAGTKFYVILLAKDRFDALDTGVAKVELLVGGSVAATRMAAEAIDSDYYVFELTAPSPPGASIVIQGRATDVAGNVAETGTRTITAAPAPAEGPATLKVEAPSAVTAGVSFNVKVTPIDLAGNPVSGFVGIVVLPGQGTAFFDGGQAFVEVPAILFQRGVQALSVSLASDPTVGGTAVIEVNAAHVATVDAKLLGFQRLAAGTTLTQLGAEVSDAFGNRTPNVPVDWVIAFFQNGTMVGQTSLTVNSDVDGVSRVPTLPVPENATRMLATASVTQSPTVSDSLDSPVVPNVLFNIAFQHQAIQAGIPVSFTITAIDPETGAVKTDFTGTVYLYRIAETLHGETTSPGLTPTEGEKIVVMFTEEDQGVKFILDGIILTQAGEQVLAASTEAPSTEFAFLQEFSFGTIEHLTLTLEEQTLGGISNEIIVLPSKPVAFEGLSLNSFPLTALTILVDRFRNSVFNEPVEFKWTVNDGETKNIVRTDLQGIARSFGPTNFSIFQSNTVSVAVTAVNYPPPAVPELTHSFTTSPADTNSHDFLPTTPTTIELGKPGQAVSDMAISFVVPDAMSEFSQVHSVYSGEDCAHEPASRFNTPPPPDPNPDEVMAPLFFSISSGFGILPQGLSQIEFKQASFTSGNLVLEQDLVISGGVINVFAKNSAKLTATCELTNTLVVNITSVNDCGDHEHAVTETRTTKTWKCRRSGGTFNFQLTGVTVDVPEGGDLFARHPDGRLNVQGPGPAERTLAFFAKTLVFTGSVIPEGSEALGKPAGVYCIDSAHVTEALVGNPGLIPINPSGQIAGTFQVRVMDNELTPADDLRIKLESLKADGTPMLDPVTQEPLPGTVALVPLNAESTTGGTISTVLASERIVAVDKEFLADDAIGGSPGKVSLTSQSSVPADGMTKARVDIRVTYEDGTPAPNATVTLMPVAPLLPTPPVITSAANTDATGKTRAFVTSTVAGTVSLSALIDVPQLDPSHPAFSATSTAPLRILFFTNIQTIVVAPGGKVKATLVRATENPDGSLSVTPEEGFPAKEALALTVEMRVKPEEEEGFRPAPYAVLKGTAPQVEFKFMPSIKAFSVPDPTPTSPTSLFSPNFSVAIVMDDGSDETSLDRGEDPNLRVIVPNGQQWESEFAKSGNTLTWTPPTATTPFSLGANRIRLVLTSPGTGFEPNAPGRLGPAIAVARMLNYRDRENGIAAGVSRVEPVEPTVLTANGHPVFVARNRVLLYFDPAPSTDIMVSGRLGQNRVAPLGYLPNLGLVNGRLQGDLEYQGLVSRVNVVNFGTTTAPPPPAVPADQLSVAPDGFQGASVAILLGDPDVLGEQYPTPMRVPGAGGFNPATGVFGPEARRLHYHHWVMATHAAHRLIDFLKPPNETVTIMMADRGFGTAAEPTPTTGNKYFIKGDRLVRPTLTPFDREFDKGKDVFESGHTEKTPDVPSALEDPDETQPPLILQDGTVFRFESHGTNVTVPMMGDGIGPGGRPIEQVVLGTGKDALVRVFKNWDPRSKKSKPTALDAYLRTIQIAKEDKVAWIFVIERSIGSDRAKELSRQPAPGGTNQLALHQSRILPAYRELALSGKLIIGAAWNEGRIPNDLVEGLAKSADAGFITSDNTKSRADLTGNDAFKKYVLCIGAMENPFDDGAEPPADENAIANLRKPGGREYRARFSNRGSRISVTAAGRSVITVDRNGAIIDPDTGKTITVGGTSSATPLVAGIAAELLLLDPTLKDPASLPKVAEYIEATAEFIDQSPSAFTLAGDPPAAAAVAMGNTGHGRVNFWKAALSVSNKGLPQEPAGRKNRPTLLTKKDPFFKSLDLIDGGDGVWYGFEVRSTVRNSIIRFINVGGGVDVINDTGVVPPGGPFGLRPTLPGFPAIPDSEIRCYFSTQALRNMAGQLLPSLPFSAAEFPGTGLAQRFMARFSIKEGQLLRNPLGVLRQAIQVVDPDSGVVILEIPINLAQLRDPGNSNNPAVIRDNVRFDSWVFHIDTRGPP